jgi:hypothetical protein
MSKEVDPVDEFEEGETSLDGANRDVLLLVVSQIEEVDVVALAHTCQRLKRLLITRVRSCVLISTSAILAERGLLRLVCQQRLC